MLRGYRGIVCAVVGLALAGAQHPTKQAKTKSGAQQEQTAPAPPTPPTEPTQPPYRPYPGYNPDPCYNAEDHDSADLCAQWRAAVAAEKAAHEARRATNWGIAATLLTLATVIGLIVSLWQTRGALREARRGNRITLNAEKRARRESREADVAQTRALGIAESHFKLAEKSSKAQLRSYLTVDRIVPFQTTGDTLSVKVFIKNVGQTPARITRVTAKIWINPSHCVDPINDGPPPEIYYHFIDSLAHGATDDILAYTSDLELVQNLNETDKCDIYVYGRLEFTDVFGDDHWMTFAYCPAVWGFDKDTRFRPCVHGNGSD